MVNNTQKRASATETPQEIGKKNDLKENMKKMFSEGTDKVPCYLYINRDNGES